MANDEIKPTASVNSQNLPENISGLPESINQLIKSNTADPASVVAAAQGIAVDKNSGKEKFTVMVQQRNKIYSYIAPFNLFFPFSIGLAITQTLMLILIAIRMYADNFNI